MDAARSAGLPALSRREARLARLVAAGQSDEEIGARLAVEVARIDAELTDLVAKLGLRSRTELALLAQRAGLREGHSDGGAR